MEFMKDFPDDRTCLHWLWMQRFSPDGEHAACPKCEVERKFHRTESRPSYSCDHCGHHIHPTAGTIFHKSSTSLQLWFYAIYLMTSTRCGMSAKQLEREIGVGYKTAWRMANKIRTELMGDDGVPLAGDVEADEAEIGGKPRGHKKMTPGQKAAWRVDTKAVVFGAVERDGRAKAQVVKGRGQRTLQPILKKWVDQDSILITDEHPGYWGMDKHFLDHSVINHQKAYGIGSTHTNTVEGLWGLIKPSLTGTYRGVSHRWLGSYIDEFTFRYNHRDDERAMFETLLMRTAK
jgi:transposase-like protein